MPMPSKEHPGIKKLIEELGELIVVLAKLDAYPNGYHPSANYDKKFTIFQHLETELGDAYAALDFFIEHSINVDHDVITRQRMHKLELFHKWHIEAL